MPLHETVVGAPGSHRARKGVARRRGAPRNGTQNGSRDSHARPSFEELVELGRRLPDKLQRVMKTQPASVIVAVSGAAFLTGVVLGSRLVRAAVGLTIPFALQYLVESELGPRLWHVVASRLRETDAGLATPP